MSFGRKLVYLLPILAFLVLFVLFLQGIGSVSESTFDQVSRKVWKLPWDAAFLNAMP